MTDCCRHGDRDGATINKPNYSHRGLTVLFPLTFFSTMVGVTFLCWPGSSDGQISKSLVAGIVFSCVAAVGAISTISLVCHIHCSSFQRASLPYWTVNHNRPATENKSSDSYISPLSASKVRALVEDNSNNIQLKELKEHSKTKTGGTPPRSKNSVRPMLKTQYEMPTDSNIHHEELLQPADNILTGVDNPASTVTADVHRSLSVDSRQHTIATGHTTFNNSSTTDG